MGDEGFEWDNMVEGQAVIDGEMKSRYPAITSDGTSPVRWGTRGGGGGGALDGMDGFLWFPDPNYQ